MSPQAANHFEETSGYGDLTAVIMCHLKCRILCLQVQASLQAANNHDETISFDDISAIIMC